MLDYLTQEKMHVHRMSRQGVWCAVTAAPLTALAIHERSWNWRPITSEKEHDDEQRHQGERNGGAEFAGPHVSSDDPRVK
jgi:hypothetical protein